jgi:WD40 repeat protein
VAPVQTLHASADRWVLTAAPSPDGKQLAFCGESGVMADGRYCGLLPLSDDASTATSIELSAEKPVDMISQLLWISDGSRVVARADRYDILMGEVTALEWERGKPAIQSNQSDPVLAYCTQRSESVRISRKGELTIQRQVGSDSSPAATFHVPGLYYGQAAALSADGRWVAATEDKSIWLFDRRAADGAPRRLEGHQGTVMALDFSPDSRYLASAGADRNAKIWPLEAAKDTPPVEMAGGHSAAIYKVVFNHRGDQIATASADGTVRMWDAPTGRELVTLEWHNAAVNDVRFHPTEDVLFTASDDGTVKRGSCRTCDMTPKQLRELVAGKDLAQLTPRDKEFVQRASKEGGSAKR